jgi:amine acid ABC transporter, permease protein, 3-TM region, His/Glu/Gln/Arg/opine family
MTTANTTLAAPDIEPPILGQIRTAQRAARASFRTKFIITWIVILGAVGVAIVTTGNADPDFTTKWAGYILGGAGLTVLISAVSIFLATILAVIGALGRLSSNGFINGAASLYVSLVRGTPLLVQIYFVFFALPQMGIVLDPIPAGIIALSFNYGAYMTEIFRAGIQAVPRGQREAAEALGMPERLVMRRIVLPQAVRIVVPAIGNDFVSMIKDSSLVSVVGLQEILWRSSTVGRSNSQLIQALLIAALVYWALTIFFSYFQGRLERRLAQSDVRL